MPDWTEEIGRYLATEDADSPLSKVRCPMLVILGTAEPQIGSPEDLERIKPNARLSRAETALIEGADHWYRGPEEAVAEAIYAWLGKLT